MKVYIASYMKKETSPYRAIEEKYLLQMAGLFSISLINTTKDLPKASHKTATSSTSYNIHLGIKGRQCSTEEFHHILTKLSERYKNLFFYIGNDEGIFPPNTPPADMQLSMSAMVFNHFLIRVMLIEQLYRVQCIFMNHPYHTK